MKIAPALLLLLALAPMQASSASAAAKHAAGERHCFYARNINGFAAQDDQTVNIRVGVRDFYQMKLMTSCPDIRWHERLGILSRGSNFICSGLDAELISATPSGPQRCPVTDIRKLSPAEITALPKGARP